VSVGPEIGRAIAAEPRIPPDRAAALRRAFMATMADPEFVADIHRRKLTIEPQSGEEVQQTVAAAMATPKGLVDQVKRYIGHQ
jgi:tripartite-type tricarboxylate transporter receptor subunit TctC